MARRARRRRLNPERILIAIDAQFHHAQDVPRLLALAPYPLTAARPEMRLAGRLCQRERFGIEVSDHEQVARRCISNNAGYQTVGIPFGIEGQPCFARRS